MAWTKSLLSTLFLYISLICYFLLYYPIPEQKIAFFKQMDSSKIQIILYSFANPFLAEHKAHVKTNFLMKI